MHLQLAPGKPGGTAARLAALGRRASRLSGTAVVRLYERAAAVADRWRGGAEGAPPPPSQRGPSPQLRHLTLLAERWLLRLRRLRHFAKAEDPVEAVHDLRVASRRLRALIDTFEPFLEPSLAKRARRPLRKVTRAVGRLREWDVHAQQLDRCRCRAQSDAERAALEHLLDEVDARRAHERRRAHAKLEKIDFDAIADAVRQVLDRLAERETCPSTTFETLATVALEDAIDSVCSERLADPTAEDVEQMHRLRIATKRLRYAIELVRPALGEHYDGLHRRAKRLQDLLGEHHDRVVLEHLVDRRRRKLARRGREVLVRGLDPVLTSLAAERRSLHERFVALPLELDARALKGEARAMLRSTARAAAAP